MKKKKRDIRYLIKIFHLLLLIQPGTFEKFKLFSSPSEMKFRKLKTT